MSFSLNYICCWIVVMKGDKIMLALDIIIRDQHLNLALDIIIRDWHLNLANETHYDSPGK